MGEGEVNGMVLLLMQMQQLVLFWVQLWKVSQEQDSLPILKGEVSSFEVFQLWNSSQQLWIQAV